jgi:DNA-binding transcriptional regulator YiaG
MSKFAKAVKMSLDEWSASIDEDFNQLKTLRERSGMSQSQFAKYFNIPTDSIQNWEQGRRKCPQYLIDLIEYKLVNEHLIKGFDDFMQQLNNKNNGSGE